MSTLKVRLAVGLALVLLVTTVLAGAVATSAAIGAELADGDHCETGAADAPTTPTPENVTAIAGNVTRCIVEGGGGTPGALQGDDG